MSDSESAHSESINGQQNRTGGKLKNADTLS